MENKMEEREELRVYYRIRRKEVLQIFYQITTVVEDYYDYDFSDEDYSNMVSKFLRKEDWKISAYDLAVGIVEKYIKENKVGKHVEVNEIEENNDTLYKCYCPYCDEGNCIHRNSFRRLPKKFGGLGLCPKLKEGK